MTNDEDLRIFFINTGIRNASSVRNTSLYNLDVVCQSTDEMETTLVVLKAVIKIPAYIKSNFFHESLDILEAKKPEYLSKCPQCSKQMPSEYHLQQDICDPKQCPHGGQHLITEFELRKHLFFEQNNS